MMVEEGVSRTDIVVASEQFFAALYGQPSSSSMTQTRYNLPIIELAMYVCMYVCITCVR